MLDSSSRIVDEAIGLDWIPNLLRHKQRRWGLRPNALGRSSAGRVSCGHCERFSRLLVAIDSNSHWLLGSRGSERLDCWTSSYLSADRTGR